MPWQAESGHSPDDPKADLLNRRHGWEEDIRLRGERRRLFLSHTVVDGLLELGAQTSE